MPNEKTSLASTETSIKTAVDNAPKVSEQYDIADFEEIERNEACLQSGDGGVH